MTNRFYFVDPSPVRSELLRMEVDLAHRLREDLSACVLSEDAIKDYVKDLNGVQDLFSRENPRLRRVEIKTDLTRSQHYPGCCDFIIIGNYYCPLRPVRKIQ
jgi:hypothetical protein